MDVSTIGAALYSEPASQIPQAPVPTYVTPWVTIEPYESLLERQTREWQLRQEAHERSRLELQKSILCAFI